MVRKNQKQDASDKPLRKNWDGAAPAKDTIGKNPKKYVPPFDQTDDLSDIDTDARVGDYAIPIPY